MKTWILYDAECGVCLRMKKRLEWTFAKRGFCWEPLQAEWVAHTTGLSKTELMREMKILTEDYELIGGVDAWIYLARRVWWMYPLYLLGKFNWTHACMDRFYRTFAANRYCLGGTCKLGGD